MSLMMNAHPWESCLTLSIGTNIGTCSKVVGDAGDLGVFMMSEVRNGEEVLRYNHTCCHAGAELLHLSMDVSEKCIA